MDVVLGKLGVPLLIFSYMAAFFLYVVSSKTHGFNKMYIGQISSKAFCIFLGVRAKSINYSLWGMVSNLRQQTHFVAAMDSRRATETAVSLVLAEVPWSR